MSKEQSALTWRGAMMFDAATYMLARKFAYDWTLPDDEAREGLINQLAQRIQDTVEEFEKEHSL